MAGSSRLVATRQPDTLAGVSLPTADHVPGLPTLLLNAFEPSSIGYSIDEYFLSGRAVSAASADEADYVTRIVVLMPDARAFNGTVLVEWLNVSGGIDAPAIWRMASREITRSGFGYVAVSAQRVGVEGGASLLGADMSLKTQNWQRYSRLNHPGDAYAYDIFTQVGRLLKSGALDTVAPTSVLAIGESQSAMFLTTYVNEIDRGAAVYDGFLVHSRFGNAAPLDGRSAIESTEPAPYRDDLRVPVMTVITETDLLDGRVLGYHRARRPDGQRCRTWEIAGAAHADNYVIRAGFIDSGSLSAGDLAAAFAPTRQLLGTELSYFINFGPQHHYVLQAALAGLDAWVRTGEPAPSAELLQLTDDDPPALVTDAHGLARGGVRTPWVDVPVARTSGTAPDESPMSFLFGSGEVFHTDTLTRLYPGGLAEYLDAFTLSLNAAIAAGHLLAADRAEIVELAGLGFPA